MIVVASCLLASPLVGQAPRSLLWKVTAPNGTISYLFGTIHLPDSTVFEQRDTILAAVAGSAFYVSELHLDSLMMPSVVARLLQRPTFLKVVTLQEKLWKTTRPSRTTIDQWLWMYAKRRSIPRGGIETIDEQLAVFDQIPDTLLQESSTQGGQSLLNLETLIAAYQDENIDAIAHFMEEASQDSTTRMLMDVLAGDRNVIMVDRLVDTLMKMRTFIAVGAAHLPGPDGMIALLRKRDFVVEPVRGGVRSNWLQQ